MTPTFEAPGVRLYLGDSAEILPALKDTFDLLATDPPYGVEYESGRRVASEGFGVIHGDRGEVDVPAILSAVVARMRRNRHVYVFGPRALLEGVERLTAHVDLIWDKEIKGMGDLTLPWAPAHETLTFAVYEPSRANRARGDGRLAARLRQGSVLRCMRPNSASSTRHPNEKPVVIMRQLVEASSCLGDLVVDPFMGSGSTIVASLVAGRTAVGIEKDPRWFAVARQRIEALLPSLRLLESA